MTDKLIDLQLFADGDGVTGASAGVEGSQFTNDVQSPSSEAALGADVGNVGEGQNSGEEKLPFEQILQMYGDEINDHTKKTVEKRLRKEKGAAEQLKKLQPFIDRGYRKYGIKSNSIDDLMSAVSEDKSYYEDLAIQNGTTAEIEEELDLSRREAEDAKAKLRDIEQAEIDRQNFQLIERQVNEIKATYPDFDLAKELENPKFDQLAHSPGVSLMDAYVMTHWRELQQRTVNTTAQAVERGVVNSIKSSARPVENGVKSTSPASVNTDIRNLSMKQIAEIMEEARRGKKITLK